MIQPMPNRAFAIYSTLVVTAFASAAGLTTIYTMLATLYREYPGSTAVGWAVTAYLLVSAVAAALGGRFGDLLGRRRMILLILVLAGAGSLVSALSPGLGGVLAGCALQGVAGCLTPLLIGLAREILPRQQVPFAIGVLTAAGMFGAGLTYLAAGWVIDHFASHGGFIAKTLISALAFAMVIAFVPRPAQAGAALPRIDLARGLLFAPALVAILLAVQNLRSWGPADPRFLGLAGGGAALLLYWSRHQLRQAVPLIEIRFLLQRQALLANGAMICVGLGCIQIGQLMSLFLQQPQWTQTGFGLTATAAGWLMMPLNALSIVAAPLSGRLSLRYGARRSALAGTVLAIAAWTALTLRHDNLWNVMGAAAVSTIAYAILATAIYNMVVDTVPPERTSEAAGTTYVLLMVAMATGSQVLFALMNAARVKDPARSLVSYPADSAYALAFAYVAAVCVLALAAVAAVPKRSASIS
jgi:MFS family permease